VRRSSPRLPSQAIDGGTEGMDEARSLTDRFDVDAQAVALAHALPQNGTEGVVEVDMLRGSFGDGDFVLCRELHLRGSYSV
jgi:hypothetical protein